MKKSDLLEFIRDEPEELDIDKLIYTLWVRRRIEIGLAEADAGLEVSMEEIDQMIEAWPE